MRPRLLLRLWFRQTAAYVLGVWLGGVALFHAVDAFENLDTYTEAGAGARVVATYLALRTPAIAIQIWPAALLLGAVLALFRSVRDRAPTAAEAAGMHPGWFYLPAFALALLGAMTQLLLSLGPLPRLERYVRRFELERIEGRRLVVAPGEVRWLLEGEALWRLELERLEPRRLRAERYAVAGTELTWLRLEGLTVVDGSWRWEAATAVAAPPLRVRPVAGAPPPFAPDELAVDAPTLRELPWARLRERLALRRRHGGDPRPLLLEVHRRVAEALLGLTVLLVALPLVPRHGRRASTAGGILLALAIGVGGWVLLVSGASWAQGELDPLGYWLPHLGLALTAGGAWWWRRGGAR